MRGGPLSLLYSWLFVAIVVGATTACIALPLLAQSYNSLNNFSLWTPALLPGAVLLAGGTMLTVATTAVRARFTVPIMAGCGSLADIILINRDLALYPDSHGLAGIEVVYALFVCLWLVVPGAIIGKMIQPWLRKKDPE